VLGRVPDFGCPLRLSADDRVLAGNGEAKWQCATGELSDLGLETRLVVG
jgi:hypothetical protein